MWGTIGWILVNLVGLGWIMRKVNPNIIETNRPILLAAACSAVLGVYSFFLPHTPPAGTSDSTRWIADIPDPGAVIEPGSPVLTFFATGSTPDECRGGLQSTAAELDRLFG